MTFRLILITINQIRIKIENNQKIKNLKDIQKMKITIKNKKNWLHPKELNNFREILIMIKIKIFQLIIKILVNRIEYKVAKNNKFKKKMV